MKPYRNIFIQADKNRQQTLMTIPLLKMITYLPHNI